MTYASETWTLNKAEQSSVGEENIEHIFYKKKNRRRVRRSKEEIKFLYKEANIVSVGKVQSLRWLGHIDRMSEIRIKKMVMIRTICGKRRGRPKARCKTTTNVIWKEKANNRMKWRRIRERRKSTKPWTSSVRRTRLCIYLQIRPSVKSPNIMTKLGAFFIVARVGDKPNNL